ncbi:hypothetical protein [Clostridium chauvoei]|uniref:Uncharacterized protein n=2 Tax=Clostridium chauvoei TaxID=46867 RepID=A0A1U6JKY2_9CLOT|nr:hypothetical protein [Clostridium chauvoei]ATD55671.1 hypothetical protein BTM20_10660 [Clostridium chauvoei]ATD56652.1 hypothetical protein BTM21_02360 [Clostridium chauvoei]MBX7280089.1 hypothetical protein [Clostridium chauvoei]MBX7282573.1 hypothetical protein [Clostridium chauvoei]MBX7284980.1 hypothetical protein [Clostridium chauvoei]
MKELFKIKDITFYEEEFLDDIKEYEDVLPIIKELSSNLDYEKIEVVDLNDCCEKTKENYIIEIPGFLNEEDEFLTKEEVLNMGEAAQGKILDIFVIRIYKCTKCNKWIIDILE